jgi:hypothetical protein
LIDRAARSVRSWQMTAYPIAQSIAAVSTTICTLGN